MAAESPQTRAQFLRRLAGGGAGLALLGAGAYGGVRLFDRGGGAEQDAVAAPPGDVRHFVSRPDLRPPTVTVLTPASGTARGSLFLAPSSGPGQRGVLIVDDAGEPIWYRPTYPSTCIDFRPARYRGEPVLTWWEVGNAKHPAPGMHVIVDATYREIARFPVGDGLESDLHELELTPRGTALVTANEYRRVDLRAFGGGRQGLVKGGVAQEIEVPSARVVWEWKSLDHVDLAESYAPLGYPWDFFHINTIDPMPDGNVLVSGRNTWTAYKVHRATGRVLWRLGGKRSDFALGRGARFAFQHDTRAHPGGLVSVFDNGGAERRQVEPHSRGLLLALDERRRRAELVHAYVRRPPVYGKVMGNVQLLPNGNVLVGWGADPHFTEFSRAGEVRFDATLPPGGQNYRAFRFPWTGRPRERPVLVARDGALYASWNGATEVVAWRLAAGRTAAALRPAGTTPRRGFETRIAPPGGTSFAAVEAVDPDGRTLARSATVAL